MDLFDRRSAPRLADTWSVYGLFDSRNANVVRYVGISNNPWRRLASHISVSCGRKEPGHKASWIRGVMQSGGDILIGIFAGGLTHEDASSNEIALIAELKSGGASLTNTTAGGRGGMLGAQHGESTKARIGAASSARARTQDTKLRLSRTFRQAGPQDNSSVGFKGVTLDVERQKWSARVTIDGKRRKLGRFSTPEEAARAYDAAAYAAWGRDCYFNFPAEIAA